MTTGAIYYLPPSAGHPLEAARGAAARQGGELVPRSDVRLFHTPDGGEIEFVAGIPVMSDGLEMAAYLSLFGGNEEDSGLPSSTALQWWGNIDEPVAARRLRSETQHMLATLMPTTANLRKLESAAVNDCNWFVTEGLARSVSATANMPALGRVRIEIEFEIDGGENYRFEFPQAWGGRAA